MKPQVRASKDGAGKRDALSLIGIKKRFVGVAFHHKCQFPAKVKGITNPGVHPLTASRTVNMSGIPHQEDTSHTESLCDTVMCTIDRVPTHLQKRNMLFALRIEHTPHFIEGQAIPSNQVRRERSKQAVP